ncbi:SWF/SNF helicase family protein [Cellulomonas sp. zg-ZUI222]|uniref:helicase-related protein n=1 Tax=Cellulomonas wangleii TaxID=2816956 RepID=UPI001A94D9BD|nr:C-terminal helicase domain-containing protein [Cellulomonas wangleii]MBO0919791.1 SWF/SNF helicase family protein [Cellulomonas wangleii]
MDNTAPTPANDSSRARAGAKGAALKTLHELSATSLHPGLLTGRLDADPRRVDESARTLVTVRTVLDQVRAAGEKAIVFAKTKDVQRALALWLREIYGLRVDIVNGDTPATGTGDTRLAKIRAFEAVPGFNVIVMSPLAVGVGLTVVGANHAIHLERHWNPAKEAQATDRIHRIGQTPRGARALPDRAAPRRRLLRRQPRPAAALEGGAQGRGGGAAGGDAGGGGEGDGAECRWCPQGRAPW